MSEINELELELDFENKEETKFLEVLDDKLVLV